MNNNRKIQEEISNIFEICLEQFEQISACEGKIPQIEMDILMGNMRTLYDQFVKLNKINSFGENTSEIINDASFQPEFKRTNTQQSKEVVHPIKPEKTAQSNNEKPVKPVEPVSFQNSDPTTRKSPDPVESVLSHMESISQKGKTSNKPVNLFDQNADAEDEVADVQSINELINKNTLQGNSLADRLKQNRVIDLKQAIGINEKFLFINELFEGSLNDYNTAITQINSLESKADADLFIEKELKLKYNWQDSSKAFSMFAILIERRFSS